MMSLKSVPGRFGVSRMTVWPARRHALELQIGNDLLRASVQLPRFSAFGVTRLACFPRHQILLLLLFRTVVTRAKLDWRGFVGKIKDAPAAACVAWRGIAKQTERR
jgi:hypothetical protein